MKTVEQAPPITATDTIELPIQRPENGIPVFFELDPSVACCDSAGYNFYFGFNTDVIVPDGSVIVYVQGGCPPYDWVIKDSKPGYSFDNAQTTDPWNTLNAALDAEGGDVTLEITDSCSNTVTGVIRNYGITPIIIDSILTALEGNLDENYFTTLFNSRIDQIETNETDIVNAQTLLTTHDETLGYLSAEYFVKFDVNGYISGFGIVGQEDYTEAVFYVDKFRITFPTSTSGEYTAWSDLDTYEAGELVIYSSVIYSADVYISAGQDAPDINSNWSVFDVDNQTPVSPLIIGRLDGSPIVGVNGNLVVAGSILAESINSEEIFTMNLQSENYVASTSGYKLDAVAGTAEFNDMTVVFNSPSNIRTQLNVADGADVTAINTAAGITGQGSLATINSADWATQVSGTGKPADNATDNSTSIPSSVQLDGTGSALSLIESNASSAMTAATNMSADGMFSVQEKATWRVQWPGMDANYTNVIAQATAWGIQAETVFTDVVSSRNTLYNYLNTTHDIWAVTPTDTAISPSDQLILYVEDYYDKLQLAVNRLVAASNEKLTADNIKNGASWTTLPADNATDNSGWEYSGDTSYVDASKIHPDSSLYVRSASTGERMELSNNSLKVYDSTGTLRVQLGLLS